MLYLHRFYKDYSWLLPLVTTVFFTYLWARMIYLLKFPNARMLILFLGIIQNLAVFYLVMSSHWYGHLFLAFGVSLYTLESISCLIDVYRKEAVPSHNILPLFCYLGFFPRYFAGPIMRYQDFTELLEHKHARKLKQGFLLIVYGTLLKLYFANSFEPFVQMLFFQTSAPTFAIAWIGSVANYFQLYFNFSAFSLCAIGLGHLLGWEFSQNFDSPLLATSVTQLWDRWNITLGRWIKYYFYLPLAMKYRHSKFLSALLLFSVLLLIGLWHGLELKFLAMGVWFGLWVVFEQVDRYHEKIPPLFKGFFTFVIAVTGFVFFKVADLSEANRILHSLYATFDTTLPDSSTFMTDPVKSSLCIAAILFCFFIEPFLLPYLLGKNRPVRMKTEKNDS